MAITSNDFFNYEEARALSGYRSAWLYKPTGEDKYSILALTESVPYVFGDQDSFEFDILQSSAKGQVEGKPSLEPVDVEVLHHRDNAYRFEKLKNKTIDFMCINGEFVGYKFSGTLTYRPNTAEADVNRATVTITPMSAQATPIFNARGMIRDTLKFATVVPATVKTGDFINLSVKQSDATVVLTQTEIAEDGTETTTTPEVPNISTFVIGTPGLYALTVSDEQKIYASWTTTVYVEL